MRAVSQDTEASAMMGINVNRTISVTFFLAGSLAAVAGLVFLLEYNIRYDTGFELGLIAFTAAVLGGIGNLPGTMVAGVAIGLVQSFSAGYVSSRWTDVIIFGLLIAVLALRPTGLFGERVVERA
jgi:branched-chain amino acid transport system permease protein